MKRRLALSAFAGVFLVAQPATAKQAHAPHRPFSLVVRTAPVGPSWGPVLSTYTGGYYSTSLVNELYPHAPHGPRRGIILLEAIRHRVPFRLLLGVWGAESSFGKATSHFGLTGYFPGIGSSGSFATDAHLAARLFARLYHARYGRSAL